MFVRAQELCESRGGRSGLPVLNSPYGLCGRKATLKLNSVLIEEYRLPGLFSSVEITQNSRDWFIRASRPRWCLIMIGVWLMTAGAGPPGLGGV